MTSKVGSNGYQKKAELELNKMLSEIRMTLKKAENFDNKMQRIQEQISSGKMETMIETEVKDFGTGGHIPFPKKFVGRKVQVYVLKEEGKKL